MVDRSNLPERIKARKFDLVVFGGIHQGIPPPYRDEVCAAYKRTEVAAVYGSDYPLPKRYIEWYSNCTNFVFTREMQPEHWKR